MSFPTPTPRNQIRPPTPTPLIIKPEHNITSSEVKRLNFPIFVVR